MTPKDKLLKALREIINRDPPEGQEDDHIKADDALLEYVGEAEVSEVFYSIDKWYA